MGLFSNFFGKSGQTTATRHIDSGRQKLPEKELARAFVAKVMETVQKEWPNICKTFKGELELQIPNNDEASFEFFMAVLATEILALPNFLPADQAIRMKEHLVRIVSAAELGSYPSDTFREYQNAWDSAHLQGARPLDSVVTVLCDKLGYQNMTRGSTIILMVFLSRYITMFCGLKDIIEGYELVP